MKKIVNEGNQITVPRVPIQLYTVKHFEKFDTSGSGSRGAKSPNQCRHSAELTTNVPVVYMGPKKVSIFRAAPPSNAPSYG